MTEHGLKRILVAGDEPSDGLGVALDKALRLAAGPDAAIELLLGIYDRLAEEPDEVLAADRRAVLVEALQTSAAEALERLVSERQPGPVSVRSRAVWSDDPVALIVEAARGNPAQLVIKPMEAHATRDRFLRTPTDGSLMRQAPCPLLLSTKPWPDQPRCVLAAVDAQDRHHQALSREILRQACRLGATLGAAVHVVTAYPDLGQATSQLQVASDYAGIKADMREARRRALADMLADLELRVDELHLVEGRAAAAVAELAERLQPAVTVLGSAARKGVARLVLGNTAETLMGRLECDLLAVREPWS